MTLAATIATATAALTPADRWYLGEGLTMAADLAAEELTAADSATIAALLPTLARAPYYNAELAAYEAATDTLLNIGARVLK